MKGYKPKSLYELFDEALKLLEKGWVQGSFKNDDGVCLVGAVEAVAPENIKLQYEMFYVIAQELKGSWTYRKIAKANDDSDETFIRRNIYLWNDCSFRKEKTVLKVIRNIRDREEKKFKLELNQTLDKLENELSKKWVEFMRMPEGVA